MKHRSFTPIISVVSIFATALIISVLFGKPVNSKSTVVVTVLAYYCYRTIDVLFMVARHYKNNIANIIATLVCASIYLIGMLSAIKANEIIWSTLLCVCIVNFWYAVIYLRRVISKNLVKEK